MANASKPDQLILLPAVISMTTYSKRSIYKKINNGTFPRPLKLDPGKHGRIAWRESDVLEWLSALPRAA